jgi:hypothetical protein
MRNSRRTRRSMVPTLDRLDARQLLSVSGLHVVPSPTVPFSTPNAVSADASNDIWAVGSSNPNNGVTQQPLVEHFDGTSWSVSPSPTLPNGGTLRSVVALASNNVWAVGAGSNGGFIPGGLIEHFEGTKWSVVSGDSSVTGLLNGVTAVAANNIWAVGEGVTATSGGVAVDLIEHFDGSKWTAVPVNVFGRNQILNAVSADAANDVWAVGLTGRSSAAAGQVLHFDGTSWSVVTAAPGVLLQSVDAISPTNVWAVGTGLHGSGNAIEHFDGTQWTVFPTPEPGGGTFTGILTGIAAVSANDIWAVGRVGGQTVTEHFDGTQWSLIASPNPNPNNSSLAGVTALPNGTVVAVGDGFILSN